MNETACKCTRFNVPGLNCYSNNSGVKRAIRNFDVVAESGDKLIIVTIRNMREERNREDSQDPMVPGDVPVLSGDRIERRIIFEFSKAIKREREGDKAEGRGLIIDILTISLTLPGFNLFTSSLATTTSLLGVAVDLRRCCRHPPGIKPLARSQGGDLAFHVEAERRRASGCRTDEGASNPRDAWWGAMANAVPDGSPRRCNAFRWLRSVRTSPLPRDCHQKSH
ncbi:hypothetical protein G5I_12980 [Acromyrmex echinatior]|uniref:Uncharacterized protein n=1 Tax=Acromyrmex echinatior TaxID=103372 RepID=F4X3R7_ACREC|nr:hypothetical protein G5I_12980 [Acromyrmex echinatior]